VIALPGYVASRSYAGALVYRRTHGDRAVLLSKLPSPVASGPWRVRVVEAPEDRARLLVQATVTTLVDAVALAARHLA